MNIRSLRRVLVAASAVAALVIPLQAAAPSRAAEPFEINVIVSLTGPFAFIGPAEAASVRAIESIVNKSGGIKGQQIKMVIQDDQSDPATAVQLASGIIAKKPNVLLGPTYLASCLAVQPLVIANNGPVTYCFAPTLHPAAGSYALLRRIVEQRSSEGADDVHGGEGLEERGADLLDRRDRARHRSPLRRRVQLRQISGPEAARRASTSRPTIRASPRKSRRSNRSIPT